MKIKKSYLIWLILIGLIANPLISTAAVVEKTGNSTATETISNATLDSKLDKTQQWVNKVSDEAENQGYTLLGANQSTSEGLTLSTTKALNDDYSVITQVTYSTNGENAVLQSIILKGTTEVAMQIAKGSIKKNGEQVLFNYVDSKTKKEGQIDLTSGHSSAAAAIPIAFSVIGGIAETASLSAAIAAAAPAVLIVGGITIAVGGGYWAYTKATANQTYSAAHASRAVESANTIQLDLSSLRKALELKDMQKINYHLNRISAYENAYQVNVSKLELDLKTINIPKIEINIPKITIPKIEVTIPKIDLSEFKNTMESFDKSMASLTTTMDQISEMSSMFLDQNSDFNKAMKSIENPFASWPKASANPTFSSVNYDSKTSILNIKGNMPTLSKIEIYVNSDKVRTESTSSNGSFNLNISAKNTSVAINAIQQSTSNIKYGPSSILGLMSYPIFRIQENGQLATNPQTNKLLKTTLPISKSSAEPHFSKVTYDVKTKMMTLVGKMPTASTIEVYSKSNFTDFVPEKIDTISTSEDGSFKITRSIEAPVISINALQNSTDSIVYTSPYFFSIAYPAFKISPEGEIIVNEETSKLMDSVPLIEKHSGNPTFDKVTYNAKTKMMTLVGKMSTASTIDIYSANDFYKADSKKIKTFSTSSDGRFDVTLSVDTPVIYIDPVQISTSKIRYVSFKSYPAFKVSLEGMIVVEESTATLFKNPPLVEKMSSNPIFNEVTYNSQTKTMKLVGKTPLASTIDINGSSKFGDGTEKKITSIHTLADGSFNVSFIVSTPVISVNTLQNPTTSNIYTEVSSFMRPEFKIYPSGQVVAKNGTQSLIQTKDPLPIEKPALFPTLGAASYNNEKRLVTVPIQMPSSSTVIIYKNNVLFKEINIEGQKQTPIIIPMENIEDTNLSLKIVQKNTPAIVYTPNVAAQLEFKLWKDGTLTADNLTNYLLPQKLPITLTSKVSKSPKFTDVTFDSDGSMFKISGKMATKSSMEVYLNKAKIQNIATNEDGTFNLSIPISLNLGQKTSIAINGTQNSDKYFKYSPYINSLDYSMFTISDKGEVQVNEFAKTLIDVKTVVTPFPTIKPIPIGKGVFVQGETLPYSDVIIKNKGLEFKGQADDKGIFSIPLNEITLEDVLEIFVIAPSTATISYTSSESLSISGSIPNTTIYTEAEMGIKESKAFENAIEISNGSLTLTSIDQLARLAEINSSAKVVTLGSYVHNSTTSYDQTAYRADNTFFSMGSEGWNTIVKKLEEAGITEIGNEMWRINEKFLENQIGAEKSFEFTLDPNTLVKESFGYREYNYLMNQGYQLQHLDNLWKVAKQ